jgi:hypothetical protein
MSGERASAPLRRTGILTPSLLLDIDPLFFDHFSEKTRKKAQKNFSCNRLGTAEVKKYAIEE